MVNISSIESVIVSSYSPNTNQNHVAYGAVEGSAKLRSLMKFSDLFYYSACVISTVKIYSYWYQGGSPITIYVRRITSSWDETIVTWNTQPSNTATAEANKAIDTTSGWKYITITQMVKDQISSNDYDYGFMYYNALPVNNICLHKGVGESNSPYLSVSYSARTVDNACQTTPTLQADWIEKGYGSFRIVSITAITVTVDLAYPWGTGSSAVTFTDGQTREYSSGTTRWKITCDILSSTTCNFRECHYTVVTGDLYVDAALGSNFNYGGSWGYPFETLKKAIDEIPASQTIHIAEGDYSAQAAIDLDKNLSILCEDNGGGNASPPLTVVLPATI